jgi:hypothetical protein
VGPATGTTEADEDVDGGPLGVLPTGPTTATTEFEEDVNGGPTWGVLPVGPVVTSIKFEEDVDDAPPEGRCWTGLPGISSIICQTRATSESILSSFSSIQII